MKKTAFYLLFVFGLIIATARTASAGAVSFGDLEMAGYLKNETSWKMAGGLREFMKVKNIFDLKMNYKFTEWLEFFTEVNYWYDHTFDIEGKYQDIVRSENNVKLKRPTKVNEWLRDCYFDVYTPRLDMRLGRQQVVWGATDGVRILDMVNPLDYREWTIKDYSELRIPLWMANIEGELMMNGHLQLLVIPDYEPNYYAPAGSPYALRTVVAGAEASANPFVTVTTIDERPGKKFENTKIGLRWRNIVESGVLSGLEYTLNYLHTYDFASSAYTRTTFGPGGVNIQLTRRAEQIEVIGGSFSKSITKGLVGDILKGWTIRGEIAYIQNGAMNYGTDKSIAGTVDVDQLLYALGFDKVFWTNWEFSTQFIQMRYDSQEVFDQDQYTLLFGPTRGPLDEVENLVTMRIATDFLYDRIKPEVLIIYGDDNDWRISPKVNFEYNDHWTFSTGVHVFEGHAQHLNGQFDGNDQVFFEAKYSW